MNHIMKRTMSVCLVFALLSLGLLPAESALAASANPKGKESAHSAAPAGNDEQRVIVTFKNKIDNTLLKGKIKREQKHRPMVAATMSKKEIEKLKKDAAVQSVEPDIVIEAAAQTTDWGTSDVQAPAVWASATGQGVKVAVIDSGIDTEHEDLAVAGGASFVDYTTSYDDDNGHGTHVAGIIGARNNEVGTVGVAPDASLYALKVLDGSGRGYLSDVLAAIDWAVDNHMDMINLSLATPVDSPALHNAVDQAYASGVLVVAAAGNSGSADGAGDTLQYPAQYSSVISVGSVDAAHQRASTSSTGSGLEVVAPGVGIQSTYLNNSYATLSGTSMAAPFVAGELALLKQRNPGWSNVELRTYLDQHTLDLGTAGRDSQYGFGLVQLPAQSESEGTDGSAAGGETGNGGTDGSDPADSGNPDGSGAAGGSGEGENGGDDSVTGDVYDPQVSAASVTVPSIIWSGNYSGSEDLSKWPSLQNAKAITTMSRNVNGSGYYINFVLYNDHTVKFLDTYNNPNKNVYNDTGWPDLTNAISIAAYGNSSTIYRFVLNSNETITATYCYSGGCSPFVFPADQWPSLVGAKGIAASMDTNYKTRSFVWYTNGRVQLVSRSAGGTSSNDNTDSFPGSLTHPNANSIAYDEGYLRRYVAYLNLNPTLTLSTTASQNVTNQTGLNLITLTGQVKDQDNDNVTVSATIGGVTKSVVVSNTATNPNWTLQWNVIADNVPFGTYTGISVSANDGKQGIATSPYPGTIFVDTPPNAPTHTSFASFLPVMPNIGWMFSDANAGDTQSAYEVTVLTSTGSTVLYNSGWIVSASPAFTVPSGVLARNTIYTLRVRVKDQTGAASAYSALRYFKTNNLPVPVMTSYTDGQQLTVNALTFTWTYSDADAHPQTAYQILGSKDNWATTAYDSGVISSAATSHTTPSLANGTWQFAVKVFDGMEWSAPVYRTGLTLPNNYEPNDTSAQAFPAAYTVPLSSMIDAATDVDFYTYTAQSTGLDRVTMTVPAGLNYDVYVFDHSMNFITAGIQGTGGTENIVFDVTAGSMYYIKIISADGTFSTTLPYTFTVSKYVLQLQTNYQYDSNGNIISKTTTKIN